MKDKRSVLVIEDAVQVRESLCRVLEAGGFDVRGCADGTAALTAAAENDFHIIITDYLLPDMSGADITRLLRARLPGSIIIGVSSDDRSQDFLAAGADAFLLKPYRYNDLVEIIGRRR